MVNFNRKISAQDLIKIFERASSLSERSSGAFLSDDERQDRSLIEQRLNRWKALVGGSDEEKFALRLAQYDLNKEQLSLLLGNVRLADEKYLPPWVTMFRELVEAPMQKDEAAILDPHSPIPFEDIYLPFVQVARQKLLERVGEKWQLLTVAVQTSIVRKLLHKLHLLITASLYEEFDRGRKENLSPLLETEGKNTGYYRAFIEAMRGGKMIAFFQKYSVIARLMSVSIEHWIDEKAEFLGRLAEDLPLLETTFGAKLAQVTEIQLDLSEPHNRRRSVTGVTFAGGRTMIYKPRGMGMEAGFFQLLHWCNQQPNLLPLQLCKVIDRDTHGWMEFIHHQPCNSTTEAGNYYERAGMLLALLYILRGNDCHEENIISAGEQPILIDLETLFNPRVRVAEEQRGALSSIEERFFDSVLQCGLLPRWESTGGILEDVSGLGGTDINTPLRYKKWEMVNTDEMKLSYELKTQKPLKNTLWLQGKRLSPSDYSNRLLEGFEKMYRCLQYNSHVLTRGDGPLKLFAGRDIRFLFRPSDIYGQLLIKTIAPRLLQEGIDRSIEFEALARSFPDSAPRAVLAGEIESLERMDVPFFIANTGGDGLGIPEGAWIPGYFEGMSYETGRERLGRLGEEDLALQMQLIRGSLYSQKASGMSLSDRVEDIADVHISPLSETEALSTAIEIAIDLEKNAISTVTGHRSWIGLAYLPAHRRYQLQPLGDNLYDGVSGIALFLAALWALTREERFRRLCLSALGGPVADYLNIDTAGGLRFARQIGIGAGAGIGSIVYCLAKIANLIEEPKLLKVALKLADTLTPETVALDRSFDLIGGAAGAIVALLDLYGVRKDESVLERARNCGAHLLSHRVESTSGWRAWPVIDGELTTGISHGAAGIALALIRLYEVCPEEKFLQAAREAIGFESSLFDARRENWQDVESSPSFMIAWCHGAPGIGLARLGGLSSLDSDAIRQDIDTALKTTLKLGLQPIDHLCCGNFGRLETLLVASQVLNRRDLGEMAYQQAAVRVATAKRKGGFALTDEIPDAIHNPGFFQGTAGIGYQLLRLAAPEMVPSVLLWQ